jgi:CRISPR/Cas system endoribonuclease Cas6 (RAMP superfamily)
MRVIYKSLLTLVNVSANDFTFENRIFYLLKNLKTYWILKIFNHPENSLMNHWILLNISSTKYSNSREFKKFNFENIWIQRYHSNENEKFKLIMNFRVLSFEINTIKALIIIIDSDYSLRVWDVNYSIALYILSIVIFQN